MWHTAASSTARIEAVGAVAGVAGATLAAAAAEGVAGVDAAGLAARTGAAAAACSAATAGTAGGVAACTAFSLRFCLSTLPVSAPHVRRDKYGRYALYTRVCHARRHCPSPGMEPETMLVWS